MAPFAHTLIFFMSLKTFVLRVTPELFCGFVSNTKPPYTQNIQYLKLLICQSSLSVAFYTSLSQIKQKWLEKKELTYKDITQNLN